MQMSVQSFGCSLFRLFLTAVIVMEPEEPSGIGPLKVLILKRKLVLSELSRCTHSLQSPQKCPRTNRHY
jgi:hypothetical protein